MWITNDFLAIFEACSTGSYSFLVLQCGQKPMTGMLSGYSKLASKNVCFTYRLGMLSTLVKEDSFYHGVVVNAENCNWSKCQEETVSIHPQ